VSHLFCKSNKNDRQGQAALKESQKWQQESNILHQEKEILENQLQSLNLLLAEKTAESDRKIHSLEDELRLSMEHVSTALKERDRTNTEITLVLKEKADLAAREVTLTKRIQELVLEVERAQNESKVKSELEIVKLQRDSLYEMIKQQEQALQIQQKQSEASLKMLHQRQAALDKYEQKYQNENEELNILQENLQKLLNHEGEMMYNELIDAKRLIPMITSLREKALENNHMKEEILHLDEEKADLLLKQKETEKKFDSLMRDYRDNNDQLEHYKKLTIDWETRAHYWQQVAKKTTMGSSSFQNSKQYGGADASFDMSNALSSSQFGLSGLSSTGAQGQSNDLLMNELRNENIKLTSELSRKQDELNQTKEELETSKTEMQKEFSSLWLAVEQLNKLDASKDKTINELTTERDNALKELKEWKKKYQSMKSEYDGLQSELQVEFQTNIDFDNYF
jgi:hypothetical protein